MNNVLIDIGISLLTTFGVGIIVAIFAKVFPKDKILQTVTIPSAEFCAIFMHRLFSVTLKLKPKQEEEIEEGVFKTIAYQLDGWIHTFVAKWNELILFSQNNKSQK